MNVNLSFGQIAIGPDCHFPSFRADCGETLNFQNQFSWKKNEVFVKEPYRTRFVELLSEGAAVQNIHDSPAIVGFAVTHAADNKFVQRELERVDQHRRNACWLLEEYVGQTERILDVGCGTGGFSVALASSIVLRPVKVVGIDASHLAVRAAQVRAAGHDLSSSQVSFLGYSAGEQLPFEDQSFDLTVCSSVLEYVTSKPSRVQLITELRRVTRPGGYVFISTPNPLRLKEYHSGRFLGDYLHRPGYPWATRPWEFSRMFSGWREIPVTKYHRRKLTELVGPRLPIPVHVIRAVSWLAPWQNRLFQKMPKEAADSSGVKKAPTQ